MQIGVYFWTDFRADVDLRTCNDCNNSLMMAGLSGNFSVDPRNLVFACS